MLLWRNHPTFEEKHIFIAINMFIGKLRKQLKEAEECIARLQKQLQLENESLDQLYQSHLPAGSRPEADTAHVECEVAEMVEEVQALERKLFLEEIALNVTDERCDFLDKNYRQAYISLKLSLK
ncbi:hypothetical protein OS493_010154 [Desmophyllum pertusum]|uniref:Uncharacterized protein n=1 Tax=Desmophyllum pertusum TaxID=174260 RepID=A0A9X0CFF8_9CNID|nr:hypothetical protein OS493_010154 [Desmophyllum pertusum]